MLSAEKSGPFGGSKKKTIDITTNERVSVFIELADAHRQLGQTVSLLHLIGESVELAIFFLSNFVGDKSAIAQRFHFSRSSKICL